VKLLVDMNLSPDWLNAHREHLEKGALLVVDQARGRIRLLPISPDRA
jgi:hypothetical protein